MTYLINLRVRVNLCMTSNVPNIYPGKIQHDIIVMVCSMEILVYCDGNGYYVFFCLKRLIVSS